MLANGDEIQIGQVPSGVPDQAHDVMINIIVLWQTVYTQAALDHLAANGYHPDPADIARLSPLGHPTINLDGRYQPPPNHQRTASDPYEPRPNPERAPGAQDPVPILVTGLSA